MFMRYFCIIILFICKCVRTRTLQKLRNNRRFIDLCNKKCNFSEHFVSKYLELWQIITIFANELKYLEILKHSLWVYAYTKTKEIKQLLRQR